MVSAVYKTIYRSKVNPGLVLFIVVALVVPLGFMLVKGLWFGVAIILLTAGLPLSIFTRTYYEIKADKLLVTCGFLFHQTIPIAQIRSIQPTRNIISSPALSLDRQEIKYGKFDFVIISLKDEDKADFYEALKKINPQISIL